MGRQLFMFIHAVDSGILPTARDVCSLFRGMVDPQANWMGNRLLGFVDVITLIDYRAMVNVTVHKQRNHENISMAKVCLTRTYEEGPFDNALLYISWWPKYILSSLIGVIVIFVLPQIVLANSKKLKTRLDEYGLAESGMSRAMQGNRCELA